MAQDIYFDNMATLMMATQGAAMQVLTEYVAPVAKDILRKHINTDIYAAGTTAGRPREGAWIHGSTYRRRGNIGDAITSRLEDAETLFVTSTAPANTSIIKGSHFSNLSEGSFLQLLETGPWGIYKSGFPRPVIKNTQKEYDSSSEIKNAMKRGINDLIGTCT